MNGTKTAIIFRSQRTKAFFVRTYCKGQCRACEIYNMLMDKYTDE